MFMLLFFFFLVSSVLHQTFPASNVHAGPWGLPQLFPINNIIRLLMSLPNCMTPFSPSSKSGLGLPTSAFDSKHSQPNFNFSYFILLFKGRYFNSIFLRTPRPGEGCAFLVCKRKYRWIRKKKCEKTGGLLRLPGISLLLVDVECRLKWLSVCAAHCSHPLAAVLPLITGTKQKKCLCHLVSECCRLRSWDERCRDFARPGKKAPPPGLTEPDGQWCDNDTKLNGCFRPRSVIRAAFSSLMLR